MKNPFRQLAKKNSRWLNQVSALTASTLIQQWMSTIEYRGLFADQSADPGHPSCDKRAIYIFWHENILIPIYLRGHCDLTMLVSQHSDAEVLSLAGQHLGFECVRGSSRRGGVSALRQMFREGQERHLAITPDGPRGPRRKLAQGPIYLASKLGLPIVCLGLAADRPWRLNSWDRFAIPKPYSRARLVISPHVDIPPNLERSGIEHYRSRIETLLTELTEEASQWAESGKRHRLEVPIIKQAMTVEHRRRLQQVARESQILERLPMSA